MTRSLQRPFALRLPARAFFSAAGMLLLVLSVAFVLLSRSSRRTGEEAMRRGLEQSADLVAQFLAGRQRSLTGGARVFVQAPYFRAIVAERRRDDILDQSFEAAAQLGADWVFVVDERGTLLAKSDEPGASGGDLGGVALVRGARRGQVTSGFGASRDSLLFHAVAVPIAVPGGAPIGVLVATRIVDSAVAADVKALTSSDVVFFVREASGASRVAAATLARPLAERLLAVASGRSDTVGRRATLRVDLGGVAYAFQGGRLTTAGGEPIGGFIVLRHASGADGGLAAVRQSLLIAGLAGLLVALVGATAVSRSVAAPLLALSASMRRMRDDELPERDSASIGVHTDEIGELASAVRALSGELRDRRVLATLSAAVQPPPVRDGNARVPRATDQPLNSSRRGGSTAERSLHPMTAIAHAHQLAPGAVLAGRYVIEAVVGAGTSAIVYRTVDRTGGETRAVKVLMSGADELEPIALAQLRSALSPVQDVTHRNVVRLYDVGIADHRPFLTLEYVEGTTLAALLRAHGSLPDDVVLSLAKQLCRAMQAAHQRGAVHGALSPHQLLIRRDGALKVSDCGMAVLRLVMGGASGSAPARPRRPPRIAGATVGAPEYMAPEQLLGAAPDTASDIYAAGVVLSECTVGTTPFRTESPLAFLAHKLDTSPTSGIGSRGSVLREIIARMAAPDREQRPTSAGELLVLLEQLG